MDGYLDCGELLPGHRFLITGLRHDGQSDDRLHSDFTGHVKGQSGEPMMAVTYEVRPGLSESESSPFVYAEVELRPTPTATADSEPNTRNCADSGRSVRRVRCDTAPLLRRQP